MRLRIYSVKDEAQIKNFILHALSKNAPNFMYANSEEYRRYETQAERIIRRFGNPVNMANLMTECGFPIKPDTIENWKRFTARRQKFLCNGRVPSHHMHGILTTARLQGIILTLEDLSPRLHFLPSANRRMLYYGEGNDF